MIKTVIFTMGYVENARNSCAIESHFRGFSTVTEALKSIGIALRDGYQECTQYYRSIKCCGKQLPTTKYCPDCGTPTSDEYSSVRDAIKWYYDGTSDNTGHAFNHLQDAGWNGNLIWLKGNPFIDPSTVVILPEMAELYIENATYGELLSTHSLTGRMLDESEVPW